MKIEKKLDDGARPGIVPDASDIRRITEIREGGSSLCVCTDKLPSFLTHLVKHGRLVTIYQRPIVCQSLCRLTCYFYYFVLPRSVLVA